MIDFDASEIDNWADSNGADGIFPRMIAKLVMASVPELSHIDLPTGSAVWMPGWDGILSVVDGNEWIPAGDVACEFSVGGDPQVKAGENYLKRTRRTLRIDKTSSTFIFFSPREWNAERKRKWMERRRRRGDWANVLAYDATDLVNWLDNAPAVADWFARLIGKLPDDGYVCLNDWWDNWSTSTQPVIKPELPLAGRTDETERTLSWLAGAAGNHYILGETRDEAIGFLSASALSSCDHVGPTSMARAVVVETPDAWRSLARQRNPMVLVRNFVGDASSQMAISNGHHVVIPLDRSQEPQGQGLSLPRLGRDETVDALISMGLLETHARSLSRRTARHLPIIRRHLLDEAGAPPPTWASSNPSRFLATLVLIGQWSQDSEADRAAMAALAGNTYEEIERELTPLLNIADAPITKVGQRWRYVSHEEAWHLLAPYLTSGDLAQFEVLAVEVLSERSPAFDLLVEERYMAGIKGEVLSYSETLRSGVARILALMATQPERMTNATDARFIPHRVVSQVLEGGSDWRTWATLNRHLPTLAEAAPDVFLEAVEKTVNDSEGQILALFEQDKDPAFAGSPHVGLLSGLDTLAWSQDYFPEVAMLFARLAEIDPGGAVANRPSSSLAELFCPVLRFTEAGDNDRLEVLSTLLARYPDVGWDVLIKVFSSRGILLRRPPQWQPWGPDGYSCVPFGEQLVYVYEVVRLLIEHVGASPARWKELVRILPDFPEDRRMESIDLLSERAEKVNQGDDIESLRSEIRRILHGHRSYPDAKWAMKSDDIEALGAAYDELWSPDPVEDNAWLFASDWIDLPEGEHEKTYEEKEARIAEVQIEAANTVLESGGVRVILELIDTVNAPHTLGRAAATIDCNDIYRLALHCVRSARQSRKEFALSYLSAHFRTSGWNVLERALDELRDLEGASPEHLAAIYRVGSSADLKTCLQRLESEDSTVRDAYWNNVSWFHMARKDTDRADFNFAIERLLDAGRSLTVAELIWRRPVDDDTIVRTLEQIPEDLRNCGVPMHRNLGSLFAKLFERLDESEDVADSEIANLEIPLIYAISQHRPILAIAREALREPSLFADLITLAFTRADGEYDDALSDEEIEARFRFSFKVFENLRGIPGRIDDGTVDSETLEVWVSESRRLCEDRDRKDIGDQRIGEVLANAPVGTDGVWPCEAVRHVLETTPSPQHIRIGFKIGRSNQRGFTSRGIFDGGSQERELAESYRKDAAQIRARWPATARLLRELAEGYESDGHRQDARADWTDLSEL